jgi:hypothetical protein
VQSGKKKLTVKIRLKLILQGHRETKLDKIKFQKNEHLSDTGKKIVCIKLMHRQGLVPPFEKRKKRMFKT